MSDSGRSSEVRSSEIVGRSATPDVSVVTERIAALDRHITAEINSLRREIQAARVSSERAIEVAADEAKERLAAHNGLIEQMRQQAQQFASREALETFKAERHMALDTFKDEADKRFGRIERFQAMLVGGMLLVSFIGVANLVKVWSG